MRTVVNKVFGEKNDKSQKSFQNELNVLTYEELNYHIYVSINPWIKYNIINLSMCFTHQRPLWSTAVTKGCFYEQWYLWRTEPLSLLQFRLSFCWTVLMSCSWPVEGSTERLCLQSNEGAAPVCCGPEWAERPRSGFTGPSAFQPSHLIMRRDYNWKNEAGWILHREGVCLSFDNLGEGLTHLGGALTKAIWWNLASHTCQAATVNCISPNWGRSTTSQSCYFQRKRVFLWLFVIFGRCYSEVAWL